MKFGRGRLNKQNQNGNGCLRIIHEQRRREKYSRRQHRLPILGLANEFIADDGMINIFIQFQKCPNVRPRKCYSVQCDGPICVCQCDWLRDDTPPPALKFLLFTLTNVALRQAECHVLNGHICLVSGWNFVSAVSYSRAYC